MRACVRAGGRVDVCVRANERVGVCGLSSSAHTGTEGMPELNETCRIWIETLTPFTPGILLCNAARRPPSFASISLYILLSWHLSQGRVPM